MLACLLSCPLHAKSLHSILQPLPLRAIDEHLRGRLSCSVPCSAPRLVLSQFQYTALPFWRKPPLEGRFSGRLPTKEDERRLAEECR